MNNIQNQPMTAGMFTGYSSLTDAQVAGYMKKQSISAYESMNAGLTIRTREGDEVTLSSNTYTQLDAFMYDRKGVVQTEDGIAISSESQREITLASGERFSFSVVGDLSEEEFEDIEAIVRGIDGIIAEMAEGDMDGAVEKAIAMETYDTVSMYSADISHETTYSAVTETRSRAAVIEPSPQAGAFSQEEQVSLADRPSVLENPVTGKKENDLLKDINKLFEKMMDEFDKHDDKQVARSKKGIDTLFDLHLRDGKQNKGSKGSGFNAIESVLEQIDKYMEKMMSGLFDDTLSLI